MLGRVYKLSFFENLIQRHMTGCQDWKRKYRQREMGQAIRKVP